MKRTSGYFHISLNLQHYTISEECDLAMGLDYANDPQIVNVPVSQSALHALASAVRNDLGSRATDPHPALTATEEQDVDKLSRAILGVKSDVERQANSFALGNRAIFENIIRRIGFHPESPHAKHSRVFESRTPAKGMIHIIVPVEEELGKPTYTFEYGIATAENVLPANWDNTISLGNTELFISALPSGSVVAIHYAVTIIPSRKRKSALSGTAEAKADTIATSSNKMVTIFPVNKSSKVQIVHGATYYHFSDVIYVIVP
jgi:hypothetical protein